MLFQSTPVIANGRIARLSRGRSVLIRGFNPRPLLLTGESPVKSRPADIPTQLFQSTPVIANGRIHRQQRYRLSLHRFNPRPLLLTGESSRHYPSNHRITGFNPRPLLLTGESRYAPAADQPAEVSIHARYC